LSGFFISDIENVNVVVGPYPLYAIDIEQIASTGANAVINLQKPEEIVSREADTKMLEQAYGQRGINTFFHIPVDDESPAAHAKGLMEAASRLNYCINEKGMKVYIHCTSSCTRATSVIILYMCLYLRTVTYKQQWRNPEEAAEYVRNYHRLSHPNMKAIHSALRTY